MAISPNTTFTAGSVYTANQANAYPFGVCDLASSSTNYTLTTSVTIATGMTASFTAITGRLYKVTYYEPQAGVASVAGQFTVLQIRETNAAGTQLQLALNQAAAAYPTAETLAAVYVGTFTAGAVTVVGCAKTSSTTGAPALTRSATGIAILLVEDIGPS